MDSPALERPVFRDANKRLDTQLGHLYHKMHRVIPSLQASAHEPILPVPTKSCYTGRTSVDLRYGDATATLWVVMFSPGDGTGNSASYKIRDLAVPDHLNVAGDRVCPRTKEKATEIMFPIDAFHIGHNKRHALRDFELEEYTTGGTTLELLCTHAGYNDVFKNQAGSLTYGFLRDGRTFGNPHAMYYNPSSKIGQTGAIQVAGFLELPLNSKLHPLIEALGLSPNIPYRESNEGMISLHGAVGESRTATDATVRK